MQSCLACLIENFFIIFNNLVIAYQGGQALPKFRNCMHLPNYSQCSNRCLKLPIADCRGGRFPAPQCIQGALTYLLEGGQGQGGHSTATPASTLSTVPAAVGDSTGSGVGGSAEGGVCGVVLIGDARGAFPPDLGQGVNSAFEDVAELAQVCVCFSSTNAGQSSLVKPVAQV